MVSLSLAPNSSRTSSTAFIWSNAEFEEASTIWHKRSEYITSSKVRLKASTKSWGSFLTNPTVSVIVTTPLFFMYYWPCSNI